ncbi:MAG: hypothetical protein AB7K24_32405 [Gemmataceae bacterium]
MARRWLLAFVLIGLIGCGSPGPRPHPGDRVEVSVVSSSLFVTWKGEMTFRFAAVSSDGTEPVKLRAEDFVGRTRPQLTLHFFEKDQPVGKELVISLEREC